MRVCLLGAADNPPVHPRKNTTRLLPASSRARASPLRTIGVGSCERRPLL